MRISLIVALASILSLTLPAQNSAPPEYDDPDAYEIYSRLLMGEQSYDSAKGTLVIRQETLDSVKLEDSCLAPEAVREFKEAIADYKRHTKAMLLQRRFEIDKPYELVNAETIGTLIKDHTWDEFYKRYPDSGGVLMVSAVGFNQKKTLAIVYTWSSCNNLCGNGSFALLKKVDGKWKLAPAGVRCFSAA
jgi:hypothetical protein